MPANIRRRSLAAGERNRRISILRAGVVARDALGAEVEGAWGVYAQAWVQILQGTGVERREAAVESASQTATFRALRSAKMAGVTVRDRIQTTDGREWDIHSVAESLDRVLIELTATVRIG